MYIALFLTNTNLLSIFQYKAKGSLLPISAFVASATFALILALQLDIKYFLYGGNSIADTAETIDYQSMQSGLLNQANEQEPFSNIETITLASNAQNELLIYEAQAKFDAYEEAQNQLAKKYDLQKKLLSDFEKQNQILLTQQKEMNENFAHFEKELTTKNSLINNYANKNYALINANRALLSRLDEVISKQALSTYENLYAEYNPVRQQIIDIIESQPQELEAAQNIPNCSIYTNEAVKPHSLFDTKGSTREELQCTTSTNEHAPIPQSKLSEPKKYKKELTPKEKKVIIYAYIPKLPHQTSKNNNSINKNIVELYKKALSNSALQSYKTNFVLLSSPTNDKNLASLDSEHCSVYEADYVASVRLNKSPTNWQPSSSLVVHDCATEKIVKRDTRYLLSDSWNEHGVIYLTPSTLDSFNLQVHSIVDLTLNKLSDKELKL